MEQLRDPLEEYLQNHQIPPSCIISDGCNTWTIEVARKLRIPRLVFHGPSCLFTLCYQIYKQKMLRGTTDDCSKEQFVVPGIPPAFEFGQSAGPGFFKGPGWDKISANEYEAERTADAIILNTFEELEEPFIRLYEKQLGKKVYTVGPLNLYDKDEDSKSLRGNKSGAEKQHTVLSWLDSQEPKSVLYVSFGSIARKSTRQLMELGYGLEAAEKPFVWVIKEAEITPEVHEWLSDDRDGFEERVQQKGLVLRGWAPQLAILSHPSVGAIMSHCGWNSMLESISLGVPVIAWPHFSDQFTNEKIAVDVLGLGVSMGINTPCWMPAEDDDETVVVGRDDVTSAVLKVMGGEEEDEEEAKEMRRRSAEMAEKAKKAVEEGGSSHNNITQLIEEYHMHAVKKVD